MFHPNASDTFFPPAPPTSFPAAFSRKPNPSAGLRRRSTWQSHPRILPPRWLPPVDAAACVVSRLCKLIAVCYLSLPQIVRNMKSKSSSHKSENTYRVRYRKLHYVGGGGIWTFWESSLTLWIKAEFLFYPKGIDLICVFNNYLRFLPNQRYNATFSFLLQWVVSYLSACKTQSCPDSSVLSVQDQSKTECPVPKLGSVQRSISSPYSLCSWSHGYREIDYVMNGETVLGRTI